MSVPLLLRVCLGSYSSRNASFSTQMLSQPTAAAVTATIATLYRNKSTLLDQDALTIVPRLASTPVPNHDAQEYLQRLTKLTNEAANSVACGSILAGPSSETDEFGDVAIWLGDNALQPGEEKEVLRILGLQDLLQSTAQVLYSLPVLVQSHDHDDFDRVNRSGRSSSLQERTYLTIQLGYLKPQN